MGFMIDGKKQKVEPFTIEASIPRGSYAGVKDIIDKINQSIEENVQPTCSNGDIPPFNIKFGYDNSTGRSTINMSSMTIVDMTYELRELLGFQQSQLPFGNISDEMWKHEGVNLSNASKQTMFLYCDLLECVPVGDIQAPLLRIINVDKEQGQILQQIFEKPRFLPIQKKSFDTVEIDIRNDFGDPMPFESGKVIATLHFRRVKNNYFLG